MKKLYIAVIVFSLLFVSQAIVFGKDLTNSSDEPHDVIVDLPAGSECRLEKDSCTSKYLELVLCTFRSYLCIGNSHNRQFSWGRLAIIHSAELNGFNYKNSGIEEILIESSSDTNQQRLNFINHKVLEYMICNLEGDALCVDGSFYIKYQKEKNCKVEPRSCGERP